MSRPKSLGAHFGSIYRHQQIILNHKFEKYGFGSGQYSFFICIAHKEGMTQKEISKMLYVDKATTNKAIKKLEEHGYVKTIIDEKDRRMHRVYLTEKGKSILEEFRKELSIYTEALGNGIDEEKMALIFEALEIVESNVKSMVEDIRKEKTHANKK